VPGPRGEQIDPPSSTQLGKTALAQSFDKQAASGVDAANNGEQQREAFFCMCSGA